ncbi:hypothetical protein ACQJBY_046368 [Aegilops geniculata]
MACAQLRRAFLSPSSIVIPTYASRIHHITSRPIPPSLACERRGRGTKMLPGAGGAAGGGGALGHIRAAARANFFLGLVLAAMALVVATSYHPSDLHVHTQSHIGAPAAYAGETQQQDCAATEADALDLRKTALMLVLSRLAQAMQAAAADVALAGAGGTPAPRSSSAP